MWWSTFLREFRSYLIKFKQVSKQWKSTIESKYFQKRQFAHRQQSRDSDILFYVNGYDVDVDDYDHHNENIINIPSSSASVIPINLPTMNRFICGCDGLVCVYDFHASSVVFNPATTWHRTLPPSNLQRKLFSSHAFPEVGFGKDKFNGTYKLVLLLYSRRAGLIHNNNNYTVSTREVFDFSTNAWRYVTPASSYVLFSDSSSVYVDGSFHWLTINCEGIKVLSFDLHTETFQVSPNKVPFVHAHFNRSKIITCSLNNRLCISMKNFSNQVIWSFDSSSKTWDKFYTIDWIHPAYSRFVLQESPVLPLAVLGEKKKKLLFYDRSSCKELVIHDEQTKCDVLGFVSIAPGKAICYSQSFMSI